MNGLDLGALARYHRQDLASEMEKSRRASADDARRTVRKIDACRQSLLSNLRAMIEIAAVRLRERQVLQRGN